MDIIAERVSDWAKDSSAQGSSPTSRLGLRPPPEAVLTFVDKIDALVRVVEARTEMDTVRSSFVPRRCDGERLPPPDADNRPPLYVRDGSAPDFSQQKDQHSAEPNGAVTAISSAAPPHDPYNSGPTVTHIFHILKTYKAVQFDTIS